MPAVPAKRLTVHDRFMTEFAALHSRGFAMRRPESFADIEGELLRLQRRFTRQAPSENVRSDIRRRIAQHRMLYAFYCDQPFETCRARFDAARKVGFKDLAERVHVINNYAAHCSQRGWQEEAEQYLEPLLDELRRRVQRSPTAKNKWMLKATRETRREFPRSETKAS